jgi:hypothetical protein
MNEAYRREVAEKVRYRPRLIPMFTSTQDVPEAIYDYNERLFVCYNRVEDRYEIHNLDQMDSFCATLPYKSLDARAKRWIWKNDIRVHGDKIFKEIEQHEEKMAKSKEREFKNWVEDVGSETQSMFAKDAWV